MYEGWKDVIEENADKYEALERENKIRM